MTMDFYDGKSIISDATGSRTDGHTQLMSLVPGISSAAVWTMLGAIPMIGENDDGAVFSLADAETLATFAKKNGLGLMSFWSIDREPAGLELRQSEHRPVDRLRLQRDPRDRALTKGRLERSPSVDRRW